MSSSIIEILKDLNEFCASDDVSLNTLKEKVEGYFLAHLNSEVRYVIQPFDIDEYQQHPFLHTMCMNKNVTLELVQYILDTVPRAAKTSTHVFCPETEREDDESNKAYALHCACYNPSCPTSVIELLLESYPSALEQLCLIEDGVNSGRYDSIYVRGLPLHYYLSRTSNVDIDTVKMLVKALPETLVTTEQEDFVCYPIHALLSNPNIKEEDMQELLTFFIETDTLSVRMLDGYQRTTLHLALRNGGITLEVVKFLLNEIPELFDHRSIVGYLPFYMLCGNGDLDEGVWFDIFQHLIDMDPTIVRDRVDDGELPIHYAAANLSPLQCKALIDLYPEPVREKFEQYNDLPIHEACATGRLDTVVYLLGLYPESIQVRGDVGRLPIHRAAACEAESRAEVIALLLKHDSNAASKKADGRQLPLHCACDAYYGQLDVVQILYDACPEAIWMRDSDGDTPLDHTRGWNEESDDTLNFLQTQLVYAEMGEDLKVLTTLDDNGWLPLHHALKDKAPLGSIKLLVRGNPSALRVITNIGALPIHIACRFSSAKVVQHLVEDDGKVAKYLVGLDVGRILQYKDMNNDTPLHYACGGGNLGVVKYLLNRNAPSVSDRNVDNKLPFHLLCECEEVDKKSTEYTETLFLLLRANPETVMA